MITAKKARLLSITGLVQQNAKDDIEISKILSNIENCIKLQAKVGMMSLSFRVEDRFVVRVKAELIKRGYEITIHSSHTLMIRWHNG